MKKKKKHKRKPSSAHKSKKRSRSRIYKPPTPKSQPLAIKTSLKHLWFPFLIIWLWIPIFILDSASLKDFIYLIPLSTALTLLTSIFYFFFINKSITTTHHECIIQRRFFKPITILIDEIYFVEKIHHSKILYTRYKVHFKEGWKNEVTFTDMGFNNQDSLAMEAIFHKWDYESGHWDIAMEERNSKYMERNQEQLDKSRDYQQKRLEKLRSMTK